jgi:hypothetical protein
MATPPKPPKPYARLHNLIWTLIYSGLLSGAIGLSTRRTDAELGCWLLSGGAVLVAAGVVLVWVRSRLPAKV